MPTPYAQAITYQFRGVTATGDSYEPRKTVGNDALNAALTNAPAGWTISGGVWWDCYRDLIANVVLLDKITGQHLAQCSHEGLSSSIVALPGLCAPSCGK